jgi:hypothetical protein
MSLAELVITSVMVEGRSKSEVARDYRISRYWVHQLVTRFQVEEVPDGDPGGDGGADHQIRKELAGGAGRRPGHDAQQRAGRAHEQRRCGARIQEPRQRPHRGGPWHPISRSDRPPVHEDAALAAVHGHSGGSRPTRRITRISVAAGGHCLIPEVHPCRRGDTRRSCHRPRSGAHPTSRKATPPPPAR